MPSNLDNSVVCVILSGTAEKTMNVLHACKSILVPYDLFIPHSNLLEDILSHKRKQKGQKGEILSKP